MEKTCGNCGWVTSVNLDCRFVAGDGRYYGRFTRPDAKPCEHWIKASNTLEQRYQQLAEVARELYKDLERVSDKRLERSKRENMLETHFNKLYDLGVEL